MFFDQVIERHNYQLDKKRDFTGILTMMRSHPVGYDGFSPLGIVVLYSRFLSRNSKLQGNVRVVYLFIWPIARIYATLLAFIALSAAQSSVQTPILSAILVIDTSNNAS